MRTLITITTMILLITISSCKNNVTKSGEQVVEIDTTANSTVSKNKSVMLYDSLPIHGNLSKKQINQYYPQMLDTVKDLRVIYSEKIDIKPKNGAHVSILHNTGTFDQMFICTHDNKLNLLDKYYIGTSTMFDKTSHTIEYKQISDNDIEFCHVDWGFVNKNSESEIDTLNSYKYILSISEIGKIIKK